MLFKRGKKKSIGTSNTTLCETEKYFALLTNVIMKIVAERILNSSFAVATGNHVNRENTIEVNGGKGV